MLIRNLTTVALVAAIGVGFAAQAEANSRFSIENQTDQKFYVYIYSGDDGTCIVTEKSKSVSPGETDSYGCSGNGKNRCKIKVVYKKKYTVCNTIYNACHNAALKVDNGAKITIVDDVYEDYACKIE